MKPRTKFQKRVVAANGSLRFLKDKHFVEVYNRTCDHVAFLNKGKTFVCGDCGNVITDTQPNKKGMVSCPFCKHQLIPMLSRKWTNRCTYYIMAIDRSQNFQVLRYFLIEVIHKKGQTVSIRPNEIFRVFIDEFGHKAVCSRRRSIFGSYYLDRWNMYSNIELRQVNAQWEYTPYDIHAWANIRVRKFTKKAIQVGLDVSDENFPSVDTICKIMKDNRFETIWKAGLYELSYRLNPECMDRIWPALKICIRNRYVITNVLDYIDYIQQLIQLGKDIRNAHYVCPNDLRAAHAKTNLLIQKEEKKKRLLEERERIMKAEELYAQKVLPFLQLHIQDKDMHIEVLPTVQAFFEEGNAMHHCVYSNKYFEKKDSLILSCRNNENKRLATIEISLPGAEIKQIRAACNKVPEQYDNIVRLISQKRKEIRKISRDARVQC